MTDTSDAVRAEHQIIRLSVDRLLDQVPMTTQHRNVMQDIKRRCDFSDELLAKQGTSHG